MSNPEGRQAESPRGFIALAAVLILSALSLARAVSGSAELFLLRDGIADETAYRSALTNGWSCAQMAFGRLQADPERFSSGATTVFLSPEETCTIIAASSTETQASALVGGQSGNSSPVLYVTAHRASHAMPFRPATWELQ